MNPHDETNPYAAPRARVEHRAADVGTPTLAGRLPRFVGAMIDGALFFAVGVSAVAADPAYMESVAGGIDPFEALADTTTAPLVMGAGIGALLLLQLFLLATRSQSLGKLLMRTRIDRVDGTGRAGWIQAIVLRGMVPGMVQLLPLIGLLFVLIDPLFIFRSDRRCIHDLIASTVVNRVE